MEKQNLTQQQHAFTNQNKCATTQNKYKKPGLVASYNIRPKQIGSILILALHKFVTYLLRHLPSYLQP